MSVAEQAQDERYRTGQAWVREAETGWGIGFGSIAAIEALCLFLNLPESDSIKWGYTREAAVVIVAGVIAQLKNDTMLINRQKNSLYMLRRQGKDRISSDTQL